jgi:hypothetical protein
MFGVLAAVDSDFDDNAGYLLVPGVGPWLMLAAGSDPSEPCPMQEDRLKRRAQVSRHHSAGWAEPK